MQQKIGVLGASFNPPTMGHQDVIAQALPFFDSILLVPSLHHAFHKILFPIENRLAMLNLLIQQWDKTSAHKIKIINIEATIEANQSVKGPIYTYDVLSALTAYFENMEKDVELSFIVGPDIIKPSVWQQFYRYQDIEKNWALFVVKERIKIRSTGVREILEQYRTDPLLLEIKLTPLVGTVIAHYLIKHLSSLQ